MEKLAMAKLSKTQLDAYHTLTGEFQSAYQLGFSIATLDVLVRKGCARKRVEPGAGFPEMKRNLISYKRICYHEQS